MKSQKGVFVKQNNDNVIPKKYGVLYKWTNFVYGWQKRYFELENGVLMYYKSEVEKKYGSRGSIALHIAQLVESDVDSYRFDLLTNTSCWYLRAENRKTRNYWLRALRNQMNSRNASNSIDRSSSSDSLTVLSTCKLELTNKMEELERYREMIGRQTVRLDKLIHKIKDCGENSNVTALLDESLALNAVTIAVLQNLNSCIHLLVKQTQSNHIQRANKDNQTEQLFTGDDRSHSPNHQITAVESIMSDDEQEWHDACDDSISKGSSKKRQMSQPNSSSSIEVSGAGVDDPGIEESPPKEVISFAEHLFTEEINRITMEQLKYAQAGVEDRVWTLFMVEGEMKMYKREVEINGIVYDPLKAVHLVQGVTAREYIHYFFEPRYKHEWDETLILTKVIKRISIDTIIIHQLHKRVWPVAQRESLFWSHVRYLPQQKSPDALDLYMVCNHDCNLPEVPLQNSSNVRVGITVAMLCETVIKKGHEKPVAELERSDIQCRICYCAQVDPGGWVPTSALRVIYKREYPKFLRGFTKYVLNNVKSQPLII